MKAMPNLGQRAPFHTLYLAGISATYRRPWTLGGIAAPDLRHDRPLVREGRDDAPLMGELLASRPCPR